MAAYAIYFFLYMAVLSVGLGIFNLVPIPPLDGSKILFALLPDRIYYQYLRYERFLSWLWCCWPGWGVQRAPELLHGGHRPRPVRGDRLPFQLAQYYFF